jgi:anion-transporting  ArsA/GET3 family ATPase
MNGIDELTLRLLTSKKKYNAYLETVEPDKSAEIRDYCKLVKKNKKRIITLFESYLDDPEKQTTNELDDAIEFCLKEFLKHFEIRDREDKSARNDYNETDESDEETFEKDESSEETSEGTKGSDSCFTTKETDKPTKNSFWGKTIMKGHFAKR